MDSNHAIELLGGTAEAARFFEVKPPSVSEWRKTGLPRARLMYLRAIRPDIFAAAAKVSTSDTAAAKRKAA